MNLWNKKQVREILKMLKSTKNKVIRNVGITSEGYVLMTDSYQAHKSIEPIINTDQEMVVTYEELEKWYKLANAKDMLSTKDIENMMIKSDIKYPDVGRFFEVEPSAIENIRFNVNLLTNYLNIIGTESVVFNFSGNLSQVIIENEIFKSLILPLKLPNENR